MVTKWHLQMLDSKFFYDAHKLCKYFSLWRSVVLFFFIFPVSSHLRILKPSRDMPQPKNDQAAVDGCFIMDDNY